MQKPEQLYDAQTSVSFYDARYEHGYMDEWPSWKKDRVAQLVRELELPEIGEALDFGCGNGVFTEVLRQALPRWTVYGTDLSSVAILNTKQRFPNCIFFHHLDEEMIKKKFDFLFTHHVLEHVYNLDAVWHEMIKMLKPAASMLHILPCGNEGSFEDKVARLRVDGINPDLENRLFFEDEGHVRRLTSAQLVTRASRSGFNLAKEYYANQHHGTIDWITESGPQFVFSFCDLSKARDEVSRTRLARLRNKLLPISAVRYVETVVAARRGKPNKRAKDWVILLIGSPLIPVAKLVGRYFQIQATREWRTERTKPNGSEMYLHFVRKRPN